MAVATNLLSRDKSRDILKVDTSFQSLDIFTNNLTHVLCIRNIITLFRAIDKEHFYLLLTVLIRKNRLSNFNSSQKLILSLFHQLKHIDFDNSKIMILI